MDDTQNKRTVTHRDLLPKDICPAFLMKHILTHSLDEVVHDGRQWPGDGYYWCNKTCTTVGPDDKHAHPRDCRPGRSCYDGPQS